MQADTIGGRGMPEQFYPLVAFTLGSLAGFADLLRSQRKITRRALIGSFLWHGLLCLASLLVLREQFPEKTNGFLLGVSLFVAMGAFSMADILIAGVRAKMLPK